MDMCHKISKETPLKIKGIKCWWTTQFEIGRVLV